jgi:signal transduction histidine kinase/sensor domain CHASE-containing protein
MKLTKKIAFFVALIFVLFLFLCFLLYQLILDNPISEQKRLFANKLLGGAFCIFESEMQRILLLSEDWASWNSMYEYVSNPTKKFEIDLAPRLTLKDAGLNLFIAVNIDKKIINLKGYHHGKKKSLPFENLSRKMGALWNYLEKTFKDKKSATGIVRSEYGPILVVSSPILHSNDEGPQNGRLMMGRIIDKSFEDRISKTTRTSVRLLPPCCKVRQIVEKDGKSPPPPVLVEEARDCMLIQYPIKDVDDKHIFTIKMATQKDVFEILDKATRLFFILLITGFILLGVLFYLMVNRLVVRRVKKISATTSNIITFDHLAQRIPEVYRDEITQLSRNINQMLERLQEENIKKEEVERMAMLNEKLIFLGRATANITHEINNPLFAIDNAIKIIKKRLPTGSNNNGRLRDAVQMVETEVNRAKNITRNMHKITMPNMERFTQSDITDIMEAAIKVIKWSNQSKQTKIEYRKHGNNYPLDCHPEALQQVFMNLILNSVEAMKGKGLLVIDVFQVENEYHIDFIDNGPGFNDAIKNEMFKPFRSTKSKGSGLGLNISNHIVTNHGGSIQLDESYTEGAHLIVKIPIITKGGSNSNGKPVTSPGRR